MPALPLLDHFHPPLASGRHWESFHAGWAGTLVDTLTENWLPPGSVAEQQIHAGARVEIDVATLAETPPDTLPAATTATVSRLWTPPAPILVVPAFFPGSFEVQVFNMEAGPTLVAAIDRVSPGNKDRHDHRRAFAVKCASYLHGAISLIIVDIVNNRRANLHPDIMDLMEMRPESRFPPETDLYAMAYRPVRRGQVEQIEMWPAPLTLGQPLPVLPLALSGEVVIPVDLEETDAELCRRRRLTEADRASTG